LWIVIGLGNPGRRYAGTRHNAGFNFVDRLARRWGERLRQKKFLAKIAEARRNDERLVLAQPQTYMNLSGRAVMKLLDGYKVTPEDIIVVYDDLDVRLGQIRVRKEGSPGTHKGMRSICETIRTQSFPRLRIGIGPLAEGEDATDFVLSPFRRDERPLFEESLALAEEALALVLDGRIDAAMNMFNQKGKT
jgi:PTH1 family peptidyl-tRNA hydrolase